MSRLQILVVPGPDPLAEMASHTIAQIAIEAIGSRGTAKLALSGGTTPIAAYRLLANALQDLAPMIHIFQADERYVLPDDPASNYRMLRETLLEPLGVPEANIHRIPTEMGSPELVAQLYENDITAHFSLTSGQFPSFDLVLLGLGSDGHTASLFPGNPAVTEHQRIAVATWVEPHHMWRITLTLPCINAARNVLFLVSGAEKRQAVRRVLSGDDSLPGSLVRPHYGRLIWLLDSAALGLGE
jgi:6-phosphogluconolactonase